MNEQHCVDLLPGYALGALDGEEHAQAVAHVRNCASCRDEAEQLAATLHEALGYNVAWATPRPEVRTQFLARLALEMPPRAADVVPERLADPPVLHAVPAPEPPPVSQLSAAPVVQRPLITRWLAGMGAMAAVLVLGLGIATFSMSQQLDDQRANLLSAAFNGPHVAMPLTGPALKYGLSGEVIMRSGESTGLVIVSGMSKKPPRNMSVRCWLHQDGHWMAGGSLHPDASGIAMVLLGKNMDVHKADQVAITLEYANSAMTAPTSPPLLTATL